MEYLCIIAPIVKTIVKVMKGIKCNGIYGVVLPKKCGKTELAKAFESDKYLILDLESSIKLHMTQEQLQKLQQLENNFEQTSYNSFYYPVAKEYIQNMKKNFKKKKIIVFHSDPELLEYVGITNTLYLCPNNKLFKEISEREQNQALKKAITDSHDMVIKLAGSHLKSFDTWASLLNIVSTKFNLKLKL